MQWRLVLLVLVWADAQVSTVRRQNGKLANAFRLAKGKLAGKGKVGPPSQNNTNVTQPSLGISLPFDLPSITPIDRPSTPNAIRLYPQTSPDLVNEQWDNYLDGKIVRNVVDPTLTPFLPTSPNHTGTAVIIAPGGGFVFLGIEGDWKIAQKLADMGVAAFVLKYRTDPSARDSREFVANTFKFLLDIALANEAGTITAPLPASPNAVLDGKAAVQLVRSRAREWNIDPTRIGFIGSSAGAMTALEVGLGTDPAIRPNFLGSVIGPKNVAYVPAYAPPLFIAAASDDPLFPGGSESIVAAWSKAKRPIEAHFYERGGHGLPPGTTGDNWLDLFVRWMRMRGYLSTNSTSLSV